LCLEVADTLHGCRGNQFTCYPALDRTAFCHTFHAVIAVIAPIFIF